MCSPFQLLSTLLHLTRVDVDLVEPLIVPAPGVGVDYLSGNQRVANERIRG